MIGMFWMAGRSGRSEMAWMAGNPGRFGMLQNATILCKGCYRTLKNVAGRSKTLCRTLPKNHEEQRNTLNDVEGRRRTLQRMLQDAIGCCFNMPIIPTCVHAG